jgi:hypothetical protein
MISVYVYSVPFVKALRDILRDTLQKYYTRQKQTSEIKIISDGKCVCDSAQARKFN